MAVIGQRHDLHQRDMQFLLRQHGRQMRQPVDARLRLLARSRREGTVELHKRAEIGDVLALRLERGCGLRKVGLRRIEIEMMQQGEEEPAAYGDHARDERKDDHDNPQSTAHGISPLMQLR